MKQNRFITPSLGRLAVSFAAAAMLAACASTGSGPQFSQADDSFNGQVRVVDAPVVYAGNTVKLAGANFKPGQQVQFFYEGTPILKDAVVADAEGKFATETAIPAGAQPGRHSVVVSATNPNAASVYPLKISPQIPLSGEDKFSIESKKLVTGLYQSAYSAKNNVVFAAAAVGRPPVKESQIVKVNPDTLQVLQAVSPAEAPARKGQDGKEQPGGVFAVYGIGLDEQNGTIWVTNTRQNTIAVYKQSDLSLIKQFAPGEVGHGRDVAVDSKQGKAYVSTSFTPNIEVFDTRTLEKVGTIEPQSTVRGPNARPFGSMSLALDAASSKLFVVSGTGEIAIVNTQNNAVENVFAVAGVNSSSGIAYDASTNRVFLSSQGSDNVAIVDAATGKTLKNVLVGAGSLNVAFDPVSKLAYVANRGSSTVTVLNSNGDIVANLNAGPMPNHISVGANGVVYVVNKGQGEHAESNSVTRIQLKK
ncbi:YncE family protein [Lampropedia puyangensis]|uniref:YncE family protein n=1 Tax=Lampropedia puyangensis TaxID=1330072 RepID=A0A4S8F395_9BURK|nr:YncE family protein [Lampropedia puyangensis]THU01497.1 YncE family protein [Lampropedia puyangensis]